MNRVDVFRKLKSPVRPFVRRHWNQPPFSTAASLAQRYLRIWNNDDHNLERNGEREVLRRLAPYGLSTLVDAGCNRGLWTDAALAHHPTATVHAFEADPVLVDQLADKYRSDARVVVNSSGLADENGTLVLYVATNKRDVSSMVRVVNGAHEREDVEVPVQRGADYCALHGIDTIDYLKIDTEGFDFTIVSGFKEMLGPRIRAVQFEYNDWNIRSRRLLTDFYDLLVPYGYRLGKVHPNGVRFLEYSEQLEDWIGPAVVAVHESAPEFVAAIAV